MANRSEERTQFLRDIITTAIESGHQGIGYWSAVSHYQWIDDDGTPRVVVGDRNDRTDAYAVIHVMKDDETGYEDEGHEITIEVVAKGLNALVSGKVGVNSRLLEYLKRGNEENDGGDIDADCADVIVQVGLLGAITYG